MRFGKLIAVVTTLVASGLGASGALAEPAQMPGAAIAAQQPAKKPMFDLRLRSLSTIAQPTAIIADDSQLRHRLIGSMIDYFPVSGTGFFVSGGGQLATRASIVHDVNSSLVRLLYAPRVGGLRTSNKAAPAATLGYVEGIGRKMELRLEGGALLGRMNSMASSLPHSRGLFNAALSDGSAHALNGVMRASFGMKF